VITTLKEFSGYSGSTVLLIQDYDKLFIRKINNVDRNIERLTALSNLSINIPKILSVYENSFDQEYISNIDIITYLLHNSVNQFVDWLIDSINILKSNSINKDWNEIYTIKLNNNLLSSYWQCLNFTKNELLEKLPKVLPMTYYHGDLTMDNIIYSNSGKFYMIDPITTEYSSYIFDLAKLMQDLHSGWFIRNKSIMIQGKLLVIKNKLFSTFPEVNNNSLLILMLLRVLPYTKTLEDEKFIINEVNNLWKS
jgi:hypothetical protein